MLVLPRQPHGPTEPKMQLAAMKANLDWVVESLGGKAQAATMTFFGMSMTRTAMAAAMALYRLCFPRRASSSSNILNRPGPILLFSLASVRPTENYLAQAYSNRSPSSPPALQNCSRRFPPAPTFSPAFLRMSQISSVVVVFPFVQVMPTSYAFVYRAENSISE